MGCSAHAGSWTRSRYVRFLKLYTRRGQAAVPHPGCGAAAGGPGHAVVFCGCSARALTGSTSFTKNKTQGNSAEPTSVFVARLPPVHRLGTVWGRAQTELRASRTHRERGPRTRGPICPCPVASRPRVSCRLAALAAASRERGLVVHDRPARRSKLRAERGGAGWPAWSAGWCQSPGFGRCWSVPPPSIHRRRLSSCVPAAVPRSQCLNRDPSIERPSAGKNNHAAGKQIT